MERGLKETVRAYLQLMRFANVFTAMADVLAGALIVSGSGFRWAELSGLLLAGSAIYAGGCVLNDLVDRKIDAAERPFRPLPSGKVSARKAWILLFVLFGAALYGAMWGGAVSVCIALVLIGLVISYDLAAKDRDTLGPVTMGACRAFNLLLGMSPHLSLAHLPILFPLVTLVYVFSLTVLSRFEVHEAGLGQRKRIVSAGWIFTLLVLSGLMLSGRLLRESYGYICLFAFATGIACFRGLFEPKPELIGRAVKAMILGIPLLDAVYAAGVCGWIYGLPVVLCLVPAVWLARTLYVT